MRELADALSSKVSCSMPVPSVGLQFTGWAWPGIRRSRSPLKLDPLPHPANIPPRHSG